MALASLKPWVQAFLERMFALCTTSLVFNAISTHVSFRDTNMFYLDPAEMLGFCLTRLSKRTSILHHNLPYNYTVLVAKQEQWSSSRERSVV